MLLLVLIMNKKILAVIKQLEILEAEFIMESQDVFAAEVHVMIMDLGWVHREYTRYSE